MPNRKIKFVRFRYSHHSPHSGYSRIVEYGATRFNSQVIPVSKPLPRSIIRERILWRLARGTPGYTREAMAAELNVAWQMLTSENSVYHFLYGETNYHYAGKLNKFRDNRVVATFHLPPVGIQRAVQIDWHLRQLSAIICVGRNQIDYFSDFLDPARLHFVPLGVDVEYYHPPVDFETRDKDLCVIVGENYRDFPTLRGVIELVSYLRPQTNFVGIIPAKAHNLIGEHPNLSLRSGVSEEELYGLYQTAALMVMPLRDATANNAVLESQACGLPMVITDIGAVRDYVSPESAVLVPPFDARIMAETILGLLDSPEDREKIGARARQHALNYAWPKVVAELENVYNRID